MPICDMGDAEGAEVRQRLTTLRAAGAHVLHYAHTRVANFPNGSEQACCECLGSDPQGPWGCSTAERFMHEILSLILTRSSTPSFQRARTAYLKKDQSTRSIVFKVAPTHHHPTLMVLGECCEDLPYVLGRVASLGAKTASPLPPPLCSSVPRPRGADRTLGSTPHICTKQ